MADFCEQCTANYFRKDPGDPTPANDFSDIGKGRPPLEPNEGYPVICEGCGPTLVNEKGECIEADCIEHHGAS